MSCLSSTRDCGVGEVESATAEKDKLTKVVADLQAQLKESESGLEESRLRASS